MYALPFDPIGGEGTEISIQDVFQNPLDSFHGGTMAGNSDQLMFWDNQSATPGYQTLYMFYNNIKARDGKWINGSGAPTSWGGGNQPTTLKINGGTAFWIKRYIPTGTDKKDKAAMAAALPEKTATVSGQVITKQMGTSEYDIAAAPSDDAGQYTLVCAGFTAPFYPNADTLDSTIPVHDWIADGCHGGTMAGNSDQLMLWNGETYASLYLASAPTVKARHNHWINGSGAPTSWGGGNQPTKVVVQPTVGFWYLRQKGQKTPCKFKVDQPYSL